MTVVVLVMTHLRRTENNISQNSIRTYKIPFHLAQHFVEVHELKFQPLSPPPPPVRCTEASGFMSEHFLMNGLTFMYVDYLFLLFDDSS